MGYDQIGGAAASGARGGGAGWEVRTMSARIPKLVQLTVSPGGGGEVDVLYALDDCGHVWELDRGRGAWRRLPVPDDALTPHSGPQAPRR